MARSTALAPPVELERVCFRYPVAGEVSLASLESIALPMCDPGSGTVPIGGHNVRDATLESLHATVGVVPQEVHLFHDTIRAKLLYARPGATEKEFREHARRPGPGMFSPRFPTGLTPWPVPLSARQTRFWSLRRVRSVRAVAMISC